MQLQIHGKSSGFHRCYHCESTVSIMHNWLTVNLEHNICLSQAGWQKATSPLFMPRYPLPEEFEWGFVCAAMIFLFFYFFFFLFSFFFFLFSFFLFSFFFFLFSFFYRNEHTCSMEHKSQLKLSNYTYSNHTHMYTVCQWRWEQSQQYLWVCLVCY